MEALFGPGSTVRLAAQEPLRVSDAFVANMDPRAPVLIVYVLGNFQRWFLRKVEAPAPPATLEWRELQRNASNPVILAEIGLASETSVSMVFALMRTQGLGQTGPLAVNGWGNVFYARDVANELRAVNVHWCGDGWGVEAMPITGITEWPIRDRVFFCMQPGMPA